MSELESVIAAAKRGEITNRRANKNVAVAHRLLVAIDRRLNTQEYLQRWHL